jgi:intracellular sulfur oxidation DsrE/DsrF family protein
MKQIRILAALAAIAGMATLLSTPVSADTADAGATKQKVVYHINYDDPKQQAGALRNVQNHINAVGAENLDLKVVLHGNGLALLLDPDSLERLTKFKHANATEEMTAKIDGLRDQGIQFQVCANTIKGRGVDVATDLYYVEENDIVPSGVAQLAILQSQGYAYIKP